MDCTKCIAFGKFCPHRPDRRDYSDDNSFLAALETGVYDCQKTMKCMNELIEELKQKVKDKDLALTEYEEQSFLLAIAHKALEKYAEDKGKA